MFPVGRLAADGTSGVLGSLLLDASPHIVLSLMS